MKPLSSQVVFLTAAGVLVAGGVYASRLYTSPPKYTGPNTHQILATAQRLQGELPKAPDAEAVAAEARAAAAAAALKRRALVHPEPKPLRQNRRVAEATAPPKPVPVLPPAATPQAITPAAKPGADLALTGIGGSGNNREAMLLNLSDKRRASAKAGDSVFGFTIAAIRDDSVDMTQGPTQVTLRLGEKSAAIEAALAAQVASANTANTVAATPNAASPSGNGTNPGGRGGEWRARMAANAFQANVNGGNGNRGGGGRVGNNNGGRRNSTTQSGARRYSNGPDSSSRYSTVSSGGANRNSRMGGFRPGGFGMGGFGGRGRGGFGDEAVLEPTSNPQEARRTGAPLIGDVEAMLEPEAFSNPQTERRTGGTSGQAFGDNSYGNRVGNNRGGFGAGGFGNIGRGGSGGRTGTRIINTRG